MTDHFEEGLGRLDVGPAETAARSASGGETRDFGTHPSVAAMRERFGAAVLRCEVQVRDEHVVFIAPERTLEILRWLHDEEDFDLLKDVTAVDYGGDRPLQVVYELWSIPNRRQLRVKAELPLDALEIDSVVPVWQTANWHEREAYDMFGVQFRGHPDLRRILMPENYSEGWPLRKDFPLRGRFTRAEQTRRALSLTVEDFYIPDELKVGEPPASEVPGTEPAATHAEPDKESGGSSQEERP